MGSDTLTGVALRWLQRQQEVEALARQIALLQNQILSAQQKQEIEQKALTRAVGRVTPVRVFGPFEAGDRDRMMVVCVQWKQLSGEEAVTVEARHLEKETT